MQSHVRRVEAIRSRVGGVERAPPDYLERAQAYETAPVEIETLSPLPLERLAAHDGATWLDRELIAPAAAARDAGFGRRSARRSRCAARG